MITGRFGIGDFALGPATTDDRGIEANAPCYHDLVSWANAMAELSESARAFTTHIIDNGGVPVLVEGLAAKPEIKDTEVTNLRKKIDQGEVSEAPERVARAL